MMNRFAIGLLVGPLLAGCAPDSTLSETKVKLAEANQKIAALEKELAEAKSSASGTKGSQELPKEGTPASPPQADAEASKTGPQWDYDVNEDLMSGSKRYTASLKSANTVSFGFPYGGEQHGTLTLRTVQGKGKDILFYIQRGQILCPSYQGCNVLVRFDDEKPMRFAANGPADHSSELIFLENYSKFTSKLKKAKRVRLSVDIYQNGAPAFEFDVSGFDPAKYQPKS